MSTRRWAKRRSRAITHRSSDRRGASGSSHSLPSGRTHSNQAPEKHLRNLRTYFVSLVVVITLVSSFPAFAQEQTYLVTAGNTLGIYDLSQSSLVEQVLLSNPTQAVAVGPNQRLAFVSATGYLSVVDLTMGREIKRFHNISPGQYGSSMTFTRDGRYLLVGDNYDSSLDIIDPATLQVVRQVSLASVIGPTAATNLDTVVVIGTKAFVTTAYPNPSSSAIAVVDLTTFTASPIPIPLGHADGSFGSPNAAATPDGRYVVMTETYNSDNSFHLLFISPLTNRVAINKLSPMIPSE